ncbi:MAG: hypothetical protein WBF05_00960 [Anaerolineales bacterium]
MLNIELSLPTILLAFSCELVDSTLGMGYGATLTPILLVLGDEPLEIAPEILFSVLVTGVLTDVSIL